MTVRIIALTMTLRLPLIECTMTYVVNAQNGRIEVSERWAQTMRVNRL
jgi:hypothetical protein